jgi:hypothetical protein
MGRGRGPDFANQHLIKRGDIRRLARIREITRYALRPPKTCAYYVRVSNCTLGF